MPGISIHVVDISRGVVASGMHIELLAVGPEQGRLIASGPIAKSGLLDHAALTQTFAAGGYEARFHVARYYREQGVSLADVAFLDIVNYGFGLSDPQAHYHLPMKCTPWGYSCFRGGA